MRQVWKFPIVQDDLFSLKMPRGAELLHAEWQPGNGFCLWALVDPDAETECRSFRFAGTGDPIEEPGLRHVSSMLVMDGRLVFHLFEVVQDGSQ